MIDISKGLEGDINKLLTFISKFVNFLLTFY